MEMMRLEVLAAYYFWIGYGAANLFLKCSTNDQVRLLTYMAEIIYEFQKYRIEPTKEMLVHAVLRDIKEKEKKGLI
jgi:hypothetical protein